MFGYIFSIVFSYLVGSIPSGLIIGKGIWGIDLRDYGSHNIGATNAWRTIGKKAGLFIFICDFLKGAIGVLIARELVGTPTAMVLGGIMAIVGHSLSIFLGFKGGKGVATGLGVIAMLMPSVTLLVFLIWFLIVKATGYVSLSSIIAAVFVPILAFFFAEPTAYIIFGIFAAVLIVVRHKSNINRLLNGTESKIKAGSINKLK